MNASSVSDFISELENTAPKVDIVIKKVDKKSERTTLLEHRQNLMVQLSECQDAILGLHISTLLLFQVVHDCMLHATGKFVPQILEFLQKDLDDQLFGTLKETQDLIMQYVSTKDEPNKSEIMSKLNDMFASFKNQVIEFKKRKPE